MKKKLSLVLIQNAKYGRCRSEIRRSVQSDLNLHCPQTLLVSPSVRKELHVSQIWQYVTGRVKKTMGKGEMVGYFFLIFLSSFKLGTGAVNKCSQPVIKKLNPTIPTWKETPLKI